MSRRLLRATEGLRPLQGIDHERLVPLRSCWHRVQTEAWLLPSMLRGLAYTAGVFEHDYHRAFVLALREKHVAFRCSTPDLVRGPPLRAALFRRSSTSRCEQVPVVTRTSLVTHEPLHT